MATDREKEQQPCTCSNTPPDETTLTGDFWNGLMWGCIDMECRVCSGRIRYYREAEQKLAEAERERDEWKDANERVNGVAIFWEQRAEAAEAEIAATWLELAEVDGHESLSKAVQNAIERRNIEALQLDSLLMKAEAELAAVRAKAELAYEVANRLLNGPPLDDTFDWFDWITRYERIG